MSDGLYGYCSCGRSCYEQGGKCASCKPKLVDNFTITAKIKDEGETMILHYPLAVCSLVVRDDGLILACSRKDNPDIFGLPGGKVDKEDQNLEYAAKRELREETGLYAHFGTPAYTSMCYGSDNKHYLTTTFIWKTFTTMPKQVEGEGRVAWVSTDVLCRLNSGKFKNFGLYNRNLFSSLNIYVPGLEGSRGIVCVDYKPNQIIEI